jgi:hypothetical protein
VVASNWPRITTAPSNRRRNSPPRPASDTFDTRRSILQKFNILTLDLARK